MSSNPERRTGKVCGATTSKGTPCQARPYQNGRCRVHGGGAANGIAHPGYKHGRYTRHLPTKLAQEWEEGRLDPTLRDLTENLLVSDRLLGEAMEDWGLGVSGEIWKALLDAVYAINNIEAKAKKATDPAVKKQLSHDREDAFESLKMLVLDGGKHWAAGDRLRERNIDRINATVADVKLQALMKMTVPATQVLSLAGIFVSLLRTHVNDPLVVRTVVAELDRILPGVADRDRDGI